MIEEFKKHLEDQEVITEHLTWICQMISMVAEELDLDGYVDSISLEGVSPVAYISSYRLDNDFIIAGVSREDMEDPFLDEYVEYKFPLSYLEFDGEELYNVLLAELSGDAVTQEQKDLEDIYSVADGYGWIITIKDQNGEDLWLD